MNFDRLREEMVEFQIAARGVRDEEVLRAFREVPREEFVPEEIAYLKGVVQLIRAAMERGEA